MKIKIILFWSFIAQILNAQTTLYSWGNNQNGQLGIGFSGNLRNPKNIGIGSNWKFLLPVNEGFFGIKNDGTLWSWGRQFTGELGLGDLSPDFPTQIGSDNQWVSVLSGNSYGQASLLGLKKDGTIWSWGNNVFGQLGHGNKIKLSSPNQIGNENNWAKIYSGGNFSFGIKTDGTLWSWGAGPIGQGVSTNLTIPTKIGVDNNWSELFIVKNSVFGIKTDGTLWSWGDNDIGQLGLGNLLVQKNPKQVGNEKNWKIIKGTGSSTFGIKTDGTLWSWGYNSGGQLGHGNKVNLTYPKQVGNDNNWKEIFTYSYSSIVLGIKQDGTLWNWGETYLVPTQIGSDNDWSKIFVFSNSFFGIKSDRTLWSWGDNNSGQLGLGNTQNYNVPQKIGQDTNWLFLCRSSNQSGIYALKQNGSVWFWCSNSELMPQIITNKTNWAKIVSGQNFSFAVSEKGTLWSWGLNDSGQLGLGDRQERILPNQIGVDSNWVSISTGGKHVLALKKDGSLWTWGGNHSRQLGIGYNRDTIISTPIQIGNDTGWKIVSCGNKTSFAIKSDGTLWGWGYGNAFVDSKFHYSTPIQIGNENDWKQVSAGLDFILFSAIKTNNSIWFATDNFTIPVQIGNDTSWQITTTGESSILALKTDGTLWSCKIDSSKIFSQIGKDKWTTIEASRTFGTGINQKKIPCKISLNGNIEILDSNEDWSAISSRSEFSSISYTYSDKHTLGIRKIMQPTSKIESLINLNGLYPIPSNNYIRFLTRPNQSVFYEIYDLQGKLILMGKTSETIDISNLSEGVFILKSNLGNYKFIKE